ncbi:MAG: hypothetical protein KIS77_22340 [Saprospiraceae bacterium]|nr:hypothetical protein [Saprospiraceae bacterium]
MTIYDLRFTIYDLGFTIYDLRFTIAERDLRFAIAERDLRFAIAEREGRARLGDFGFTITERGYRSRSAIALGNRKS